MKFLKVIAIIKQLSLNISTTIKIRRKCNYRCEFLIEFTGSQYVHHSPVASSVRLPEPSRAHSPQQTDQQLPVAVPVPPLVQVVHHRRQHEIISGIEDRKTFG